MSAVLSVTIPHLLLPPRTSTMHIYPTSEEQLAALLSTAPDGSPICPLCFNPFPPNENRYLRICWDKLVSGRLVYGPATNERVSFIIRSPREWNNQLNLSRSFEVRPAGVMQSCAGMGVK